MRVVSPEREWEACQPSCPDLRISCIITKVFLPEQFLHLFCVCVCVHVCVCVLQTRLLTKSEVIANCCRQTMTCTEFMFMLSLFLLVQVHP